MQFGQPAYFAVLLGDELLVERRDLDIEVVGRQVEVGAERLRRVALTVPFENERLGLVLPGDAVEVEQLGELALRVVREPDSVGAVDGPYGTGVDGVDLAALRVSQA
ncbi:MAG: hypothetical protein ACYDH6_17685 [Acidimicrobiales bacterium]